MAIEIERKFLVRGEVWRGQVFETRLYRQGYLAGGSGRASVRVRVSGDGRAYLCVKGPSHGLSRTEFEYPVPLEDAEAMLAELRVGPLIEKRRHLIRHAGQLWEVDEFMGENEGLILAEAELPSEGAELAWPDWIVSEVSGDPRYFNSALSRSPFRSWPENAG